MSELKPCPWCKRTPMIGHSGICSIHFFITCDNFGCPVRPRSKTYDSKEEAIEAWNNREEE